MRQARSALLRRRHRENARCKVRLRLARGRACSTGYRHWPRERARHYCVRGRIVAQLEDLATHFRIGDLILAGRVLVMAAA